MKLHGLHAMLPVFLPRMKMSIVYHEGNELDERRVYYGNEFGSAKVSLLCEFAISFARRDSRPTCTSTFRSICLTCNTSLLSASDTVRLPARRAKVLVLTIRI